MILNSEFNKNERLTLLGLLILMLFALLVNLGIYPLYLEEPRRGLIALEMIFRDNYLVPTQTGDLYFRKPPFYNWLLILSYQLFGSYSEFATRIVSVVSLLTTGGVIYGFFKSRIGERLAVYSALGYIACVDILFYFSMIGEIDLFYSLVTFLVFVVIIHFGEREKYWPMFFIAYGLTVIGFLTKGLTSLPYLAISLLVYFIYQRKFKVLFSIQHIVSIVWFFGCLALYFYGYSLNEDASGWYTTLFSESADKAVGGGFLALLKHFFTFPLITLANLLPVSFFIPVLFFNSVRIELKSNRFVVLLMLLFAANFMIYWFSAEVKSRYIYPLFPLFITIILVGSSYISSGGIKKYTKILTYILLSIATIALPIMLFIEQLEIVDNLLVLVILLELLMSALWWLYIKKNIQAHMIIIGAFLVLRLAYSFTVPVTRQMTTGAAEDKALGLKIAEITHGEPLHRFGDVRMSLTIVFYLEGARQDIISQKGLFESGYYFVYEEDLPAAGFSVVEKFHYHNQPIYLIRVKGD
uniref:ArnT family glycosyltransferase n=1 Tax=Roseivirga sp. TaxID=1964215 RepID=UPI00404820C5